MKNIFIVLLFLVFANFSFGQNFIPLANSKTVSKIIINEENRFVFVNSFEGFYLSEEKTKDGLYAKLSIPGYFSNNDIGNPDLPVFTKLIEIPNSANVEVNIIKYEEQIIQLNNYGFNLLIKPNQPSLRKDIDPSTVSFEKNKKVYVDNEFYSTELIKIENLGKMRGINIAQLIVSPFSYNIESNTLTIINKIEVEIKFNDADYVKTYQQKASKYSPFFEQSYKQMWNYKASKSKDILTKYPVKYVIVSDRMFEEVLQPFIAWKTKKGFNVITAYTDEIGNSTSSIKTYLKNLYESGTDSDPAPTYLLIVGDVAQIPSFQMSGHVSDIYYCEFDGSGDYIPEMYYGRFSATTPSQLYPQIEKTLLFEQYTFQDPSYLNNIVLVAGTDNSWAPTHANGQVNYANANYFNEDHNMEVHKYMHPNSGSQISSIISNINSGAAFVNYTAHCDANGWAGPSFLVSNVSSLLNKDEYFFSVGNCCQSNKFEEPVCFGEALLRADGKGAVAHLGGSDNTYWDEDFYWSVGLTSNITANPTYAGTQLGAYDHLFHENGEEPYVTAGQINYIGNMSVMASTSSRKKYYWEIYHVMGDPSLMPYAGVPQNVTANYTPVANLGMSSIIINTEHDAYVALSLEGVLLDAKLADETGIVELEFPELIMPIPLDIVITKQFRAPHISQITVIAGNSNNDAAISIINSPDNILHVAESAISPKVTIMNLGQNNLETLRVGYYYISDNDLVEVNWEGSLGLLETELVTFPEITLVDGTYTFTFFVLNPNGETDENELNNTSVKTVKVYSGKASIIEIQSPSQNICNQNGFTPEIIVKNNDIYPLTSLVCYYECGNVSNQIEWNGNVESGQSTNIQFPFANFNSGANTITYFISIPNGGTNINTSGISLNKNFYLVHAGQTVKLVLKTDTYSEETSWELKDEITSNVIYSENSYSGGVATYTYEWCLGPGCYKYTIYDSYGDGMNGSWGTNRGNVNITNTSTNTTILSLNGNGFSSSYSVSFCIDGVECPADFTMEVDDESILLTGSIPSGGTYSGIGVVDGYFYPLEAGIGIHVINYTYVNNLDQEMECTFNITVENSNVVGIPDYKFNEVEVFPNPTSGILSVINLGNVNIEIRNMMGQIIKQMYILDNSIQIDMSNYPEGTYFIRVIDSEKIVTKKVCLQK